MPTVENENNLNLSILPANAQQELIDFYQFLVDKYVEKQSMNQFEKLSRNKNIQSLKGAFSQYADTSKHALEKSAWENHLLNKHGLVIRK